MRERERGVMEGEERRREAVGESSASNHTVLSVYFLRISIINTGGFTANTEINCLAARKNTYNTVNTRMHNTDIVNTRIQIDILQRASH